MLVFISHGATDDAFADAMSAELTRHGYHVWDPNLDVLPGDNWMLESGRALERADAVVFVLSADSIDSPSAKREIQYVIAQAKFEHRVFPVRVGKDLHKIPWVFRDLVIDASSGDAEGTAQEIVRRLHALKSTRRASAAKRRVRATPLSSTAAPKTAKARKGTQRRARRLVPNG
jgi:hypothetical protein